MDLIRPASLIIPMMLNHSVLSPFCMCLYIVVTNKSVFLFTIQ